MESIYSDYLRSNEAVPAELAHMKAAASAAPSNTASPLSALPTDSLKILMGVDRSYLEAAFAAIDDKYGSFANFVSKGLLLTPADVESLRSRLLEPAGNAFVRKP
jgi:protein-tyrosine phosphatase